MPKAHKRRTYRSASRRRSGFPSARSGLLIIIVGLIVVWWLNIGAVFQQPYSVRRQPTVSADLINRVLAYYHSPAAGKGQALYNDGVKYGIDPVYALAFFRHESMFGTSGVATVTRSLGNIRASEGYQEYDGYRKYRTWEEGFEDWYQLIAYQYVKQWGLTSVDQIIPVYAPSADNNDVTAYIESVKNAVDTWRNGYVVV